MVSTDTIKFVHHDTKHSINFPEQFFKKLTEHGIGLRGQTIVELGTGTGEVAREFAKRHCTVVGIDSYQELINEALSLDKKANIKIDYLIGTAEKTGLREKNFDVVITAQRWAEFNSQMALQETHRILSPIGHLVIAHLHWLPIRHNVAVFTQQLILQHFPQSLILIKRRDPWFWLQDLSEAGFEDIESLTFDVDLTYTPEAWRSYIRTEVNTNSEMGQKQIQQLDLELGLLLKQRFPTKQLQIPHRCFIVIARPPGFQIAQKSPQRLIIRLLAHHEPIPWDLLLMTDPSRSLIKSYLARGRCYAAIVDDHVVGVYVLIKKNDTRYEIINISILPKYQHKGLIEQLLQHATEESKKLGAKTLEIGASNSNLIQLSLYQKCGFRITNIETGYFAAKYPANMMENGIRCTDKLQLTFSHEV